VFASRGSKFPIQYIQLPYDFISYAGVATIEAWVRFEATNNPLPTLFSFGSFNKEIAYQSRVFTNGTKGAVDVFIAIVFNTKLRYSKVYVDGKLKSNRPLNVTTNIGAGAHWDFIGRNARNSTPGLTASIDELRIIFGELDKDRIYNDFIVGVDPSHVNIPSTNTMSDLALNFYSTSTQPVEVGLFGGESKYRMFGPESVFTMTPVDMQCAYNITARMNPQTSSFKSVIAAMNYTVDFISGAPAPVFAADACDTTNAAGTKCFCDNSKTPLQYLTDAGQLSQDLTITSVDPTPYVLEFIYHSGLCLEVVGSETFSLVEGNKTVVNGTAQSCFSTGTTMLTKGQNKSVNIVLFERYPSATIGKQIAWPASTISASSTLIDFTVPNAVVAVLDQVSGGTSPVQFPYNTTLVQSSTKGSYAKKPAALQYTINAGRPRPSFPFDLLFQVYAARSGPDGTSSAQGMYFIPIIGAISKEVPNFYPVASNPNMIFLVLRDPPGGGSSTTIHAGTTIDFAMSVDGMFTYDDSTDTVLHSEVGVSLATDIEAAPLGLGPAFSSISLEDALQINNGHHFTTSSNRLSHTAYEYSFSFEYDFSTSTDPNIAGHPSDVIIGGGVDLIVSEAIQGELLVNLS